MKTTEVIEDIIGKRCKCVFSGLMVTGTIEEVKISEYTAEVKVKYDEPHQWGNDQYDNGWSFGRLSDEFGSLRHLKIIDDKYEAIHVTFVDEIDIINKRFTREYQTWGVVNLKEWIDNYESSRFTKIDTDRAIITSEYNMEHIIEWLNKNIEGLHIKQL